MYRTQVISIIKPKISNKNLFHQYSKQGLNRINKYTAAVRRVDVCTKAETGVGAAMAAGNHEEKGI